MKPLIAAALALLAAACTRVISREPCVCPQGQVCCEEQGVCAPTLDECPPVEPPASADAGELPADVGPTGIDPLPAVPVGGTPPLEWGFLFEEPTGGSARVAVDGEQVYVAVGWMPSGYLAFSISRLDWSSGPATLAWTRVIRQGQFGAPGAVAAKDGAIYLGGTLDSGLYLARLDPQGTLVWERTVPGNPFSSIHAITIAADGSVYAAGLTSGPLAAGARRPKWWDSFLAHYSPDGTLLSIVQPQRDLAIDALHVVPWNGRMAVVGQSRQTGDLTNEDQLVVFSADAAGQVAWLRQTGFPSINGTLALAEGKAWLHGWTFESRLFEQEWTEAAGGEAPRMLGTWPPGELLVMLPPTAITHTGSGEWLVAGPFGPAQGLNHQILVSRHALHGDPLENRRWQFDQNGLVAGPRPDDLAARADGRVVVVGTVEYLGGSGVPQVRTFMMGY